MRIFNEEEKNFKENGINIKELIDKSSIETPDDMLSLYDKVISLNYLGKLKTPQEYLKRLGYVTYLYFYYKYLWDEETNKYMFSAMG